MEPEIRRVDLMSNEVKILIGADVVPSSFAKNLKEVISERLLQRWLGADLRVFNLETPLCDDGEPIEKCGPNIRSAAKSVEDIALLNPDLVLLANNHILDYGESGLFSTENLLNSKGICHVGVGKNLKELCKHQILQKNGLKIAVYNCAETEFSIATENSAGANPFDPLECFDCVQKLKQEADFVIVCYHGGKEFYPYPSPYLQKVFHKFAEKGADLVIAQHSHCIGCEEIYQGSRLIYGQGNFLFRDSDAFSADSLLVEVCVSKEGFLVDYIPLLRESDSVDLSGENRKKDVLDAFFKRSAEIRDGEFVEKAYSAFCRKKTAFYLRQLKGNGLFLKVLSKIFPNLFVKLCKKENLLAIQNFIECEAHRELLLRGLSERLGSIR